MIPIGPLDASESFVQVARPLDAATAAGIQTHSVPGTDNSQSFYIAINKKEIGQRWFLSAFMKQFFPGAVMGGAARSLGTRVVTFRVQNDKLFVFDASDNHKDSDTFDPTLIIEAYPIVTSYSPFNDQANAGKFFLFDPAAGLNRFGVVADQFAFDPTASASFQVDAAYMQDFRRITDGVTFEQVFTGAATGASINDGTMTGNVFRASGTLGLALRKYAEGTGFQTLPDDGNNFYFKGETIQVPNAGTTTTNIVHWNIHPGMQPIKWLISDQFLAVQKAFPQYDVIGAVERGITNWNEVFGFQALSADVAKPTDSYADDDTNYILFDADPTFGAAFANWRQNPNTGEIRGASVYFNAIWLGSADSEFSDDVAGPAGTTMRPMGLPPAARPKAPSLTWGTWRNDPLCVRWADNFRPQDAVPVSGGGAAHKMTKKQKVEAFLTHVVVHEVGHTLGLRHNFKGSVGAAGSSTSVMEYILDPDAVAGGLDHAGPYDIAAIKQLYGLAKELPTQPFCTDQDTRVDPDCNTFDRGADPLTDYYAPNYGAVLSSFLTGKNPTPPNTTLNSVLQFVRAGATTERRQQGWNLAISGLQVPVDAQKLSSMPALGVHVDVAARRLFSRLFIDDATARGNFTADPPGSDAPLASLILTELKGNLLNADNVRSFDTRRVVVDVLKKLQTQAAYDALVDASTKIAATVSGLQGSALNSTNDLLARIDAATNPYFIK